MAKKADSGKSRNPAADLLVIFGITGDLAKKMTFRALYRLERRKMLEVPIIGVARNDWGDDELRAHAREAIEDSVDDPDSDAIERLCRRLTYLTGDYGDPSTFERLGKLVGKAKHPVFYLEIPPSLFAPVVRSLSEAELTAGARVVIEKPFGHDLQSAEQLNAELGEVLEEDQ